MVSMQEKAQTVIWLAEDNPLQQWNEIFLLYIWKTEKWQYVSASLTWVS
jgi:hypothetical protein